MKRKLLLTAIAFAVVSAYGLTYADDNSTDKTVKNGSVEQQTYQQKPNFDHRHHGEFGNPKGNMHKYFPSKAEMEKKKAEFEKRLKLTDEQKKQIEENRKLGHEKVKPIFEQKKEKMLQIKEIYNDSSLTQEQKNEKALTIKSDIKKLDEQANVLRKENMNAFESVLTDKQKKEFAKIKEEQKKDMEKRKAAFEKKMKKAKMNGKHPEGFMPPPPFEEK